MSKKYSPTYHLKYKDTVWIDLIPGVKVNAPSRPINSDDVKDIIKLLNYTQELINDGLLKKREMIN